MTNLEGYKLEKLVVLAAWLSVGLGIINLAVIILFAMLQMKATI